jgi:Tol biopolymer transport system component
MRRSRLAIAVLVAVAACVAGNAQATFPGSDGPIVFRADDFTTGLAGPLMRANPDGSDVTQIHHRHAYFSDFRADGQRIAVDIIQRDLDTHIAVLRPDGSDFHFVTSGRGVHDSPSWSPNGKRIAFNYSPRRLDDPRFKTRLWTIRANGTHMRRLPMSERGFDVEPKFSPDGRWVVFNRLRFPNGGFAQAVFIVSRKGNHRVRRLTPWAINAEHPTWSPDGDWIIYNTAPNGTIQVIRPNGEDRQTIVAEDVGFGGHKPWFSPEGEHILFMCENQGTLPEPPKDYNQDLCVMEADGDDIVNITETPDVQENYPAWGVAPDPNPD